MVKEDIKIEHKQLFLFSKFRKGSNKMKSNLYLIKLFLKASRPRHWTKNLLVFLAPIFTFQYELIIWMNSFKTLVCFCLISSGIYIFNDIIDAKYDRLHPVKKYRPIAAKLISKKSAYIFLISLITISLIFGYFISNYLFLILFTYFIIQISYCIKLKQEPIFELICISSGFLLRAIAGGVSSEVTLSPWFLLSVGLLALFLALEKRKAELRNINDNQFTTRKVLKRYSLPLLLRWESLVATSSFVTYSLWASGPALQGAKTSWMLLSVPFVLIGIFRYQLIGDPDEVNRMSLKSNNDSIKSTENPEKILLEDKVICITVICWLLSIIIIGLIKL